MNNEICPIGTESLLESLGWQLSPSRRTWMRRPCDSPLPAGSTVPDRLGKVAAARMSEISPEKKLPFGLGPEYFEDRN